MAYDKDQEVFSQEAGKLLNSFVDVVPDETFPRKSLMLHSMGNHVVFNGACGMKNPPQVQFENIFMVAAVSTRTRKSFTFLNSRHSMILTRVVIACASTLLQIGRPF